MDKEITRKEFFKQAYQKMGSYVLETVEMYKSTIEEVHETHVESSSKIEVDKVNWARPPGALGEKEFKKTCTQCDDCIKACPHWVIRKAGDELGENLAGSPIIVPNENPCLMCKDFPCIPVCTPKALQMPQEPSSIKIGLAVVNESSCYMTQGQPCDYCMVKCPVKPKAIVAMTPGLTPEVSSDLCTGCGKCAQVCPTQAIDIKPHLNGVMN